jgi:hypothetical protein
VPKPSGTSKTTLDYPDKPLVEAIQDLWLLVHDELWNSENFAAPLSNDLPPEERDIHLWKQILELGSPPEKILIPKDQKKDDEDKDKDKDKEKKDEENKPWKKWNGEAIKERVWKVWNEGPPTNNTYFLRTEKGRNWRTLCLNIRAFCQRNGIPGHCNDPIENINHLGHNAVYQMSFIQDLHDKIGKLKDDVRHKNRIIAVLSFRHLLESLPPRAREGGSATKSWTTFWDKIWGKAAKLPSEHPLAMLRKKFVRDGGKDLINEAGRLMYDTLSTSIHRFDDGKVELSKDQWDDHVYDLLMVLMPERNLLNGEVDWEKERTRLGYYVKV